MPKHGKVNQASPEQLPIKESTNNNKNNKSRKNRKNRIFIPHKKQREVRWKMMINE
jgi:hypothetical protein